jgi:hypothetical protein
MASNVTNQHLKQSSRRRSSSTPPEMKHPASRRRAAGRWAPCSSGTWGPRGCTAACCWGVVQHSTHVSFGALGTAKRAMPRTPSTHSPAIVACKPIPLQHTMVAREAIGQLVAHLVHSLCIFGKIQPGSIVLKLRAAQCPTQHCSLLHYCITYIALELVAVACRAIDVGHRKPAPRGHGATLGRQRSLACVCDPPTSSNAHTGHIGTPRTRKHPMRCGRTVQRPKTGGHAHLWRRRCSCESGACRTKCHAHPPCTHTHRHMYMWFA